MAFYTGIDCPVCGKPFQEGDDVVTCPACGTPSHRSCYEQLGHCPHNDAHQDGFVFDLSAARKEITPNVTETASAPQEESMQHNTAPVLPPFGFPMGQPAIPLAEAAESKEKICGERMSDVAAVVRTQIPFYLRKFKRLEVRRNKCSWNWSAFIFGPYWFFFRRMSKLGVLFLAVQMIVSIVVQALFAGNLNEFANLLTNAFGQETLNQVFFAFQPEHAQKLAELAAQANLLPYFAVSGLSALAVHLACCFTANRSYQGHCLGIVRRVRDQIDKPEVLERFTAAGYPVKTKTELLRLYLTQMGGTSFFSVLTGYMGYYLVTTLINTLLS